MTGKIEGGGAITPELKAIYKKEFLHGVDLFKRSLIEYEKTDDENKKIKFKDVMDKALQVMNETAKLCLGKKALQQEKLFEKDYQNFITNGSSESLEKLNQDINKLEQTL